MEKFLGINTGGLLADIMTASRTTASTSVGNCCVMTVFLAVP